MNEKISWKDFDILVKEFNLKDLEVPFKQINSLIKLYLTIPTSTCGGERCFSVLILIKSFLRLRKIQDQSINGIKKYQIRLI